MISTQDLCAYDIMCISTTNICICSVKLTCSARGNRGISFEVNYRVGACERECRGSAGALKPSDP